MNGKTTRIFQVAAVVMAVMATLAIARGDAEAQKRGGILTVGIDTGPLGWDPHMATAFSSWNHYELIYESLVRFNQKLDVEPSLAESWKQPDAQTYVFQLRKGVKFHNGREMTADDVKYSFERLRNPKTSAYPSFYESLRSVDALDKHTVKLTLSVPDASFLPYLAANRYSAIVPREVVEKHGDLKSVAVGTGPFKLKRYVPGDVTEYERHTEYWDKDLPRVDGVIYRVMKDETSRLAGVRRGTLDIAWVKEPQVAELAAREKGLTVQTPPPARQSRFWLQHDRFPFNTKKLRQAIAAAIDREAMIKTVVMGRGEVTSAIPPSSAPYTLTKEEVARLPFYRRDPELARKLLREAGHPNGFEFTVVTSDHSPDYMPIVQMMQSQLRDVGIKLVIQQVEWGIHLNRWQSGDFQGLMMGGVWAHDPDAYIRPFFHSKSKGNYGKYVNPEVDRLLDESRVTVDLTKRIEMWRRIQEIMADDIPIIWVLVQAPRHEIIREHVKGYDFMPDTSRQNLRSAWIDK
jgi:peptide/nickel transport system substrate-binding protein